MEVLMEAVAVLMEAVEGLKAPRTTADLMAIDEERGQRQARLLIDIMLNWL